VAGEPRSGRLWCRRSPAAQKTRTRSSASSGSGPPRSGSAPRLSWLRGAACHEAGDQVPRLRTHWTRLPHFCLSFSWFATVLSSAPDATVRLLSRIPYAIERHHCHGIVGEEPRFGSPVAREDGQTRATTAQSGPLSRSGSEILERPHIRCPSLSATIAAM